MNPPKPGSFSSSEPEGPSTTPLGVQILSFLCGLLVAYLGFKSVRQDYVTLRKLSHLEEFTVTPGKFLRVQIRRDSVGSPTDFYPDVLYEYFVDGKSVWGWRLSYEEEPRSKTYWEGRLASYSTGGEIQVYVNPSDPKDAILEKKHESLYRTWIKMGLGVLFLLAGLVLAILPAGAWAKNVLTFRR